MYEIVNKIVLITGAANGIGAEVVKILLKEGAKQVAVLDIDEESGNDLQELLCHEYGKGKMKYMKCDITKEDQLFGAFNAIADDHGHIDIVINNAGLVNESTMDLIRKEIETAVVQSTIKALELMRSDTGGNGGTIINVSSIVTLYQQCPAFFVYFGTKSAVLQFSNCIGKQEYYSRTGVRVLTVCFGVTNTDMISKMRGCDIKIDEQLQKQAYLLPMQEKESAALGLIEAFKRGKSGSTWVVANNKPTLDITENINKAYNIMSEPLRK